MKINDNGQGATYYLDGKRVMIWQPTWLDIQLEEIEKLGKEKEDEGEPSHS